MEFPTAEPLTFGHPEDRLNVSKTDLALGLAEIQCILQALQSAIIAKDSDQQTVYSQLLCDYKLVASAALGDSEQRLPRARALLHEVIQLLIKDR